MTKSQRKSRTLKQSKNSKNGKKGGCGCGIGGGKTRSKKVRGGSSNLESLPIRYYYQMNTEENNPQDPSVIGNSTKQFLGGKSNKNKNKSKKNKSRRNKSRRNKKVKGGMLDSILNGSQVNVTTGFGTTMGSSMAYNMQNISSNSTDDITNQPAGSINNEHSHPLV